MNTPKLILINGPTGIGKTTIAKRYIDEHPFALLVSDDDIIANIGQWLEHEREARKLSFNLARNMVATHLQAGHDVVMPHLLEHPEEAAELESLAEKHGALFFECALLTDKEESVVRALERGSWGEPGSPPMTEADRPILEQLFDAVQAGLAERPNATHIISIKGDIDGTYRQLLVAIERAK